MRVDALAIGQQAKLSREPVLVTARTGLERERLQQLQIRKTPQLHPFRRRRLVAVVHVGRGGQRSIDPRQRKNVVRIQKRRDWIRGARTADHVTALGHPDEASSSWSGRRRLRGLVFGAGSCGRHRMIMLGRHRLTLPILKRRQHLTVGQPDV